MPQQYIITGTITPSNNTERAGIKIQAFDRELPSLESRKGIPPQALGETFTDAEGRFQISYTLEQFQDGEGISTFRRSNTKNADLSFSIFDTTGKPLSIKSIEALQREFRPDQIIFNAPASLEVSIFLDELPPSGTTEIELLMARIAPVVGDLPLLSLSDEDVSFLINELGFEQQRDVQQRIEWLRRSAFLSKETGLAVEAFYGWGRMNVPADMEELTKVPFGDLPKVLEKLSGFKEEKLRDALLAAIEEHIIPDSLRIRVDELVRQLTRRSQVLHEVIVQLLDADTTAVVAGYTVTVFDVAAAGENHGLYMTDGEGKFSFTFYTAAEHLANAPSREFRLEVFSPAGEKLPEDGRISVALNKPEPEIIPALVTIPKPDIIKQQEQLKTVLLDLPAELQAFISQKKIRTLSDIRRTGGLGRLVDLPMALDPTHIRQLDSLADLDRISTDITVSKTLLHHHFDSVLAVSDAPHSEFVGKLTTGETAIGESDAARLHVMATAQTHLLNNLLMKKAAHKANGFKLPAGDGADEDAEQTCGCSDCEAAVSPGAYLTALLDYTLKHVRNNKSKIDLPFLADTFHQPFIDLPAECDAGEKELRQVRICIEVLRRYRARPLADAAAEATLTKAEKDYCFVAYAMLLTRIGTSFEEIRRIRTADPEDRKALAERLGIHLTEPRPADLPNDEAHNGDELDMLFLDPGANPPTDHLLTEQAIEKLFGFVDTTRDPLSDGPKLGDDPGQITRWNLDGVVFGQNTDPDGRVYLSLTNPSPAVFNVALHQDFSRTKLIASGKIATATGTVKLVQQSNSGLSGTVDIAYTVDSTVISWVAIPSFLSWQLNHLRMLWSRQDYPADAYDNDAPRRLPIIDPDVIGPDDFRAPVQKTNAADPDKAFDLWMKRRQFTDTKLSDLKTAREANGLPAVLKQVLGNPLPDIDGLWLTLTKSDTAANEVKLAKDSIAALHLSVESFTQLMTLRAKDQSAQRDVRTEKVSEPEWDELYSILVQALKTAQYDTWRTAEQAAGIEMGPESFWFSVTEPKEGDWPPVPVAEQPLIDPDILKQTDLPDWLAGKEAINVWNLRKARVIQISKELKVALDSKGFEFMLRLALGHPTPGKPLQHDLTILIKKLGSTDNTVRDKAIKQVQTDFHLTVENFNRLVAIKAADEQADVAKKPTATEWNELVTMLTPARKSKHEYPQWIQEETSAGPIYWKALKAKLPRWRATATLRQTWQQALRVRSQSPVIDPTVMGADDLQHVIAGDAAFDLWKDRNNWFTTVQGDLKVAREGGADALARLDLIISDTVGVEREDLEALEKDRQAGQSVGKRLEQLNLESSGFHYLLRIRGLANAAQRITALEWETLYATLAQVTLRRAFARMRGEEQNMHMALSPDFFKISATLLTPLPFLDVATPPWLSTWQARRDWQDILQSRIDTQGSITAGLALAAGAVEELALPVLRDALIEDPDAAGGNLSEKAEWITARLLIDAKSGGCRMTTRVAQALETLQTLIFDLRSGQFKQLASSSLSLVSDYFDEEWKWIGSYATWRSAMFVYIYPENIAVPSLVKNKTPGFEQLLKNVRSMRINSASACREADAYASYFRDVCSLEIEATCQASTIVYTGDGCDRQPTPARSMFYMFGRASSGKMYWSAYETDSGNSANGQTLWAEVNGFEDTKIIRIVGAMTYRKTFFGLGNPFTSYIHVFCITVNAKLQRALKLARLNLDDFGVWNGVTELTEPIFGPVYLDVFPLQTQFELTSPGLVFSSGTSKQLYYRELNYEGDNWDGNAADWTPYLFSMNSFSVNGKIEAVVRGDFDTFWLITSHLDQTLRLMLFERANGKLIGKTGKLPFQNAVFLGAVPGTGINSGYLFYRDNSGSHYVHFSDPITPGNGAPTLTGLIRVATHSGTIPANHKMLAYKRAKNKQAFYMYTYVESGEGLSGLATLRAVPRVHAPLTVALHLSGTALQQRRQQIIDAFALNADATASVRAYLLEAYYFVPLHLALALQSAGQYLAALDCFRTIYDYESPTGPPNQRNIYYGLELDATLPDIPLYQQTDDWLLDPLNPHAIAATRRYTYTRFTLMSLVRCLLDFADDEFTQETSESLAKARTLYITAMELLNVPELQQKLGICDDLIAELKIEPGKDIPPEVPAAVAEMLEDLTQDPALIGQVKEIFRGKKRWEVKLTHARAVIHTAAINTPLPPRMGAMALSKSSMLKEQHALLVMQPLIDNSLKHVSATALAILPGGALVTPTLLFCIPPNPMLNALRLHAEINLYKLRTCRNIAGMKRQLDLYSAPTDTTSGIPAIGVGGQLILPGLATLQPSLYRYPVLIERAKQLVQLAAQVESAMLTALEKQDAEAQTLLLTKQQLSLAQAGVRLQDLRIGEANDAVELANLQQERAQIQIDTYQVWLDIGANEYEKDMIFAYTLAAFSQKGAANAQYLIQGKQAVMAAANMAAMAAQTGPAGAIIGGALSLLNLGVDLTLFDNLRDSTRDAINFGLQAQIASLNAALERRKDEWTLQKQLAEQDSRIGEQQKKIAADQVQIVTQERTIAGIGADNAKDSIEFLTNKFTNVQLYDWMGDTLERVYRFFLQQAIAMAKLAENQLAFQRQEVPPAMIMSDYWNVPSDNSVLGNTGSQSQDRRGLTGSARLLQDIYQLDQYAFNTDKRKLQLSKTISLARLAPVEFERFRETGVMPFSTPMELFDRGFPGHYLRLIKRVRTSIIALIPPIDGIHATLSTTGPSRVAIGGDIFQTVPIRRGPEFIAMSAPNNSTGVFELDPQPDMYLPFEGSGVEMSWEFNMPKAANAIDYRTIADVLITLDYTALYSADYRQQVIQSLKPTVNADRPFSFRNQFADQWYDLHNPAQTATPMTVRFTTVREDFPVNLGALKIQHILVCFVRADGSSLEVAVNHFNYTSHEDAGTVGGSATTIDGIISTRRGNAGSWTVMIGKPPVGVWELALPDTEEMRSRFGDGSDNADIIDILFVVTYSGRTPAWAA